MPLNHTDTELQSLRINNFATLEDYREAYSQGLIDANEISFIDENIQPDWNQTDPNEPDYIKNKPDIGTGGQTAIGTGVLTITQGGVVVGTFSANSDVDKTVNITSEGGGGNATALTELNDVELSQSLSGGQILRYNSSSSKWVNEAMPTIPTVNDATLTIQRNGSTIGTFTANSSAAKTVNIEVPAAQVNSDWNSTSGVSQILNKPTIPSAANTGVLTIQRNGVTMGTFGADDSENKSVNVTVSTVAVSGSYNDLTDKPTLAEDFNCNFTITPDPNASEDTEFPSDATVTCDKTPAEIFSASEGGKNIVAKIDTSNVISELGTVSVFDNFISYLSVIEIVEEGTTISLVVFNCRCWVVMGYTDFLLIGNVAEDSWQIEYAISSTQYESLKQLKDVATSGYYGDLTGKPQINTDNSASLTVSTNETLLEYGTPLNLHRVSKTGLYSDLIGTPTIPAAANSGILTIQKNSTTIGTFGANDSGNKSVNIVVPTTAADVNALASSTKYGASLSLTMGTTDYVVTAQLKDQDGNNLGSAQTIDLPLESVVVSGSYDNTTKKVILTLKNGSTVDFSVADLVSGLQSEITSSNKLSADLVQDGTTNKVFTSTEKTKLSGIAQGAEVNVQSDWNQTTTTADDYIKNKPTIPTVGTLNTNNSTAQTATTESLSGTINLHKVAKTGTYSDLIGTPTIPAAANNSTITIQKNGTNVDSFTTNASSGKSINIQVSELPSVSASDNGKVLQVVNGVWTLVTPVTVYIGSGTPSNSIGTNGDIYLQN